MLLLYLYLWFIPVYFNSTQMNSSKIKDVIIIGAGQAGLSTSYLLNKKNIEHIVFERDQIGSSWTKRWDSFKLNSPNHTNVLPGEKADTTEPIRFFTGKEFVNHLHQYALKSELPVQENSTVTALTKSHLDSSFLIEVNHNGKTETWKAKQIVVASGGEVKPKLPSIRNLFPKNIYQIHSSEYRNPAQLPAGDVLIIGSATSGVQIAEDLSAANRNVYLSTSSVARLPRRYRGRDIMDWMTDLHFFEKPTSEAEDFELNMKAPLMSGVGDQGHTISLQSLEAKGVKLLGYLKHVENNKLIFENNLADHIAFGDGFSSQIKDGIEQLISGTQMQALPLEEDEADMPVQEISGREPILELDIIDNNIKTIIWATGFTSEFSWVNLDVFDERKKPIHHNGITSVQGLYFMGLPWQRNLKSSLIYGTAGDAEEVTEAVLKYHSEKKDLIET